MRRLNIQPGFRSEFFHLSCLMITVLLMSCSGGSSGGSSQLSTGTFESRTQNLYQEVPIIEIQGNEILRDNPTVGNSLENNYTEVRDFNPQSSRTAEEYDSDGDGLPDTQINPFESIANAANRLLDHDLAECIIMTPPPGKELGYLEPQAWLDAWEEIGNTDRYDYKYPDTMPATADANGTDGTQFIQLIIPFPIQGSSIFIEKSIKIDGYVFFTAADREALDYLNPYYVTFVNEDWDESLRTLEEVEQDFDDIDANPFWTNAEKTALKDQVYNDWNQDLQDLIANHVPCTALVDGVDKDGFGPNGKFTNKYKTNWDELKGVNVSPGANLGSIVFIAQSVPGRFGVYSEQPFTLWATNEELRINLKKIRNSSKQMVETASKWFVLLEGANPEPPRVVKIEASEQVLTSTGRAILDWDDPMQTTPDDPQTPVNEGDPKTVPLVHRSTSFLLHFDKPVIPETVGQSIVFGGEPFNGNISPIPTIYGIKIPSPNPCANNGIHRDPIGPNLSIESTLFYSDGSPSYVRGIIPFRVHPLHQNNLCTYVLNPVIDLPGSDDLGSPPLGNDQGSFTRMRLTVKLWIADQNDLTGKPTEFAFPPVNMGVTGYFGLSGENNTTDYEQTFTVEAGGRYVNAPVSPHAIYYTMGNKGLGVVDLDGNGFTTNNPKFQKAVLVTSQKHFFKYGNAGMGNGNTSAYAARATVTGAPPGATMSYIGLGAETPMPGINEGSKGIDEIVKDSKGSAQLFPDPNSKEKTFNITDVEVGDFLDTVYFDTGNEWVEKSYHLSAINPLAEGAWANNMISTPPTPNPPPLTIPIGMRATDVIFDDFNIIDEGAFVIMGKEVFTVDLTVTGLPSAYHTGFIHLNPADQAGTPNDMPFPPNPDFWIDGVIIGTGPINIGPIQVDYQNLGPIAESSTIGFGWYYGSRQQIGNFLFVADKANNVVQVLNSNTMDVITTLSGLSAPDSVAVSPDLRTLYVSNSGGQSISVFNVDPNSDDFLNTIAEILVGIQPKGICCQPENESVFVCNYGNSTISIINPKTNSVRKTMSSLLKKPWDMVCGPRQIQFGFGTQVFHGYVSNYGGDNVLIYESGPSGYGGVGYDDILDPVPEVGENGQKFLPIQEPRGIIWDVAASGQYTLVGGCFVGHRSGSHGVVTRIEFTSQQGTWGPIFLIPNSGAIGGTPGFGKRQFLITAQWGGLDNPLSGNAVADIALPDYNRNSWLTESWQATGNLNFNVTNLGDLWGPQTFLPMNNKSPIRIVTGAYQQTFNPDLLFVAFLNNPVIDVVDVISSQVLKTITGLPKGTGSLKTYFEN
ncbi:MAG: YncE family protein [Planctomycetota bacterium]